MPSSRSLTLTAGLGVKADCVLRVTECQQMLQ